MWLVSLKKPWNLIGCFVLLPHSHWLRCHSVALSFFFAERTFSYLEKEFQEHKIRCLAWNDWIETKLVILCLVLLDRRDVFTNYYRGTFNSRTVLQGYLLYLLQHNKFLPCFPLGPLLHAGHFNAGLAREFIPRLSWIIQTLRPIVLKSFHWDWETT